jgi:hypothetical protein
MAILPTDIRILFTNSDIITYFLNLASCSEHFMSIKHQILATFDINKSMLHVNSLELIKFKKYSYEIGSRGNQLILYNGI